MKQQRLWTSAEIASLRSIAHLGTDVCAHALNRSHKSIECTAQRLGISLRVRDRIGEWRVSEEVARRIRERMEAGTCPACGRRPISVEATGLCAVCHIDRLSELKREQIAVEAARRRLATLRQQKSRLRVCEVCGEPWYPRRESLATVCPECAR